MSVPASTGGIGRTLIVGIGGCGAEVIKRVRRFLIDHFGCFENIPIVRFLCLDTDPHSFRMLAQEVEEGICRLRRALTSVSLTLLSLLW